MLSVDLFTGRHNITTVVSTVNKQRGLAMQHGRKSYEVSEHEPQNATHQQYYSIVESIHRLETQAILPSKWQTLAISRTPRHRQRQPSQSILRSQWSRQLGPEGSSRWRQSRPVRVSSNANNVIEADGIRKVRFANRFDRRFYVKGSQSTDQLARLSWENNSHGTSNETEITAALNNLHLSPISTDVAMAPTKSIHAPEPTLANTIAIDHISQAIREEQPVQEVLRLLQDKHFDHTIPSLTSLSNDAWIKDMYSMVKTQLAQKKKQTNKTTSNAEKEVIENLSHIKTLLNIYLHCDSVVQQALALTQWNRFEITVESLSLDDHNNQRPSFSRQGIILGEVFHSSEQTSHKLKSMGKLPEHCIAALASTKTPDILPTPTASSPLVVDYTRMIRKDHPKNGTSNRYCINNNAALTSEKKTGIHLKVSSNNFDNAAKMERDELTTMQVGQVRIPCTFFRYLCRQPEKSYTLERDLVTVVDTTKNLADHDKHDDEGASATTQKSSYVGSVKFSIRKVPLKKGFLKEKEKLVREKLQTVLDWIQRFRDTTGLCALPGHSGSSKKVVASSNCNSSAHVSLLHAAILVQSPDMVEHLIALGSNPFADSGVIGDGRARSSMALALTMWDRCEEGSYQKETVNTMIRMLQGVSTPSPDNYSIASDHINGRNASKVTLPANPPRSTHKSMDVAPKLPAQPRSPTTNSTSVEKENRAEKCPSKKEGQRKKKKSQSSRRTKDPVSSLGDPLVASTSSRNKKNKKSCSLQEKMHKRKENAKTDRPIHRCA